VSAARTATLRILAAPAVELIGRTFPIPAQGCSVGREPGNELVLRDDAASRRHARFDPAGDGGWEVVDTGSGNGVWVNDRRVTRHRLASGDLVQIGHTKLQFVAPQPDAPAWAVTQLAGLPATGPTCMRCGNPLPGGVRFCGHCGAPAQPGMAGGAVPLYHGPAPQHAVASPAPPYVAPLAPPPYHPPPPVPGGFAVHPPGGAVPGLAPPAAGYAQPLPTKAPARSGPSGCAIGCFALSLLLFFGTVVGSVWALHHTGHLRLPGVASAAAPPG
jgi:hypothetical protein